MSWIPQDKGLLPYFLLLVSISVQRCQWSLTLKDAVLSWGSTISAYLAPTSVAGIFTGPNNSQVTGLSIRSFGSWLILSGFVRFYAAYNLSNPAAYATAFCTFIAISWFYLMEWLVYRTIDMGITLVISLAMDCGALIWMPLQWNYYLKQRRD